MSRPNTTITRSEGAFEAEAGSVGRRNACRMTEPDDGRPRRFVSARGSVATLPIWLHGYGQQKR